MREVWDWQVFGDYLTSSSVFAGAITTVWLTAVTLAIAIAIGILAALLFETGSLAARVPYYLYTYVFRGTPILVLLVFVYAALPQAGISLSVTASAILALSISEGAYMAEIIRSSIAAIGPGQLEAADAMGMKRRKAMVFIVLPQALRLAIPPTGNEFNRQLKNTSLVSVISMTELFRVTEQLAQMSLRILEAMTVATLYYLVLTGAWTIVQRTIEKRLSLTRAMPTPKAVRALAGSGATRG